MKVTTYLMVLLISLSMTTLFAGDKQTDFSGEWVFNESKSTLDEMGTRFLQKKMILTQSGNDLTVQKVYPGQYEDEEFVAEEKLTLDGKECKSEFWNSPRTTTAAFSVKGDTLKIASTMLFERDGDEMEVNTKEQWSIKEEGKILLVKHVSSSDWGVRDITMIFDKKEAAKPAEEKAAK